MQGEKKLILAVLIQAIEDEDWTWFDSSEVEAEDGYTFLYCCRALGLTPSNVRRLLHDPESRASLREALTAWRRSQGMYQGGRSIGQRFRGRAA